MMRQLWLKYLKGLLLLLGLTVALTLAFFQVVDFLNEVYGGEAPYFVRLALLLVFIFIFLLFSKITIDKSYRDLQEAKEARKKEKRESKRERGRS